MKTFIAAQLGLAPLAAFWVLLGFGSPDLALAVGLVAALAMTAWRGWRRELYLIEIGALATFFLMAALDVFAPAAFASSALWLSFAGLGVTAVVSVAGQALTNRDAVGARTDRRAS